MADRVLRTVLTGRDELTSVLAKAAASTRAFENTVEDANAQAARSSTAAASVHKTAAQGVVSATKDAHRAVAGMGDDFEREGNRAGGLLAQGVRSGFVRQSPLIIAAVSGALIAGAPLLLAGAGALFGVLGTVAAAQADEVQSAWVGTWGTIKTTATQSAAVLEPTLIGVAARVGARFEELGPRFAAAFEDTAPLIDEFADSVLDATENTLPGLFRAVDRGQPVMRGFGDLLESIGTGLSDMFDAMSEHSPAAGRVFTELGRSMEKLLPLLGELLGQGAELAADVLPGLTGTLGALLAVTRALGPTLPVIIAGLSAMRIGKSIAGGLDDVATKLGRMATNGGAFSRVAGGLGSGVSAIAANAGAAGAAIGFMAAEAYAWTEAGRNAAETAIGLGRAFETGGRQADAARTYLEAFNGVNAALDTGIGNTVGSIEFLGYSLSDLIPDTQQAKEAYEQWYRGLDDGARAAEDVAVAQAALRQAVSDYGPTSTEAARAADELAAAEDRAAAAAAEQEQAIRGVTDAMIAQTDAVLAAANSEYAHRVAVEAANDSFIAYNEALAEYGAGSEEASDAAMRFEGDLLRVVAAAGQLAEDALPANMDANERLALSQLAQLDALRELAVQYGDNLPGSLRTMMAELERSTAGYDRAKLEADALAEGTKTAQSAMEGLAAINARPTVDLEDKDLKVKTGGALAALRNLGDQKPKAAAYLDTGGLNASTKGALSALQNLAAQRPTPKSSLSDGTTPVINNILARMVTLAAQRPKPVASATDNATPIINGIINRINSIPLSRTSTINIDTVYRTYGAPAGGAPLSVAAPNRRDGGPIYAATGRKIVGPGGPRDDLVRAYVPNGPEYRVSPGEWIVNAAASRRAGDAAMAALNAGMARVVMNQPPTAQPGYSPTASPWAAAGRGTGPANVRADVRVFVGDREITDIARVEAAAVLTDALDYAGTRASN